MVNDELKKYLQKSFADGFSEEKIKKELLSAGWSESEINQSLKDFAKQKTKKNFLNFFKFKKTNFKPKLDAILIVVVLFLIFTNLFFWFEKIELQKNTDEKFKNFYTRLVESQISFTDAEEIVFPSEQKFLEKKNTYIEEGLDFVEVDLNKMQLTIYDQGLASTSVKVLTKGKEGSWWETPTGSYRVLGKSVNAYSSIGNVWMPYSLQFYGNYLIHGWPYYENGKPVPEGYSGGCIRLSDQDAKKVFEFVKINTPILVLDEAPNRVFGTLVSNTKNLELPNITAKAFIVSDLTTGEIIAENRSQDKLPIASIVKLMTGVVSHEIIYLGKMITVNPKMLAGVAGVFNPQIGDRYIGLDLLYPLLMQSSNEASKILSGFVGDEIFVRNMNLKAESLQMKDTKFADASGISAENISTAEDLVKLLQYIYYKRPFLFEIGLGVNFENVGLIKIGDTINTTNLKNFNEFVGDPDLIGIKNGETTLAKQTIASVWRIKTSNGDLPVAIVVLGSDDRKGDTEVLLQWLREVYRSN